MLIRPIAEAISFADEVIVLSKRPTKIKKVFKIEFPEKTKPTNHRNNKEFNNYWNCNNTFMCLCLFWF